MNIDERGNYSQDGQSFQNNIQYKEDDSVSNVLDNSINDDEQGIYNQEEELNEDYKDSDDLDLDDYEEESLAEEDDLEEDYTEEDDLEEDDNQESDFNETNLDNDINETGSQQPREF